MPRVRLTLKFRESHQQPLDVPVEVRTPASRLVKRVLASAPLDLPAGDYHLLARLPGGQLLHQAVRLWPGQGDVSVELAPAPEDQPADPAWEPGHFLSPLPWAKSTGESGRFNLSVQWFGGNPLAGDAAEVQIPASLGPQQRTVLLPDWAPHPSTLLVQVRGLWGLPRNIAVPASPNKWCEVYFADQVAGSFDVRLQNVAANLLLSFLRAGMYSEAAQVMDAPSLGSQTLIGVTAADAEELLRQKLADPVAAAVAAYALLRLGDLKRLHDWTANLMNWFPWLPDGAALRGEHLARAGRHPEAAKAFLAMLDRGLPFLCDGLTYAMDRLREYSRASVSDLDADSRQRAGPALERLTHAAGFVDFRQPLLSFAGADPNVVSLAWYRATEPVLSLAGNQESESAFQTFLRKSMERVVGAVAWMSDLFQGSAVQLIPEAALGSQPLAVREPTAIYASRLAPFGRMSWKSRRFPQGPADLKLLDLSPGLDAVLGGSVTYQPQSGCVSVDAGRFPPGGWRLFYLGPARLRETTPNDREVFALAREPTALEGRSLGDLLLEGRLAEAWDTAVGQPLGRRELTSLLCLLSARMQLLLQTEAAAAVTFRDAQHEFLRQDLESHAPAILEEIRQWLVEDLLPQEADSE